MTRFARAKGSKASNLKEPDDSTPWEIMKDQMLLAKKDNEEAKKREVAEQQRIDNYSNFLKEQRVQKRKATWCDFPDTPKSIAANAIVKEKAIVQKNKQKKKNKPNKLDTQNIDESTKDIAEAVPKKKKKNSEQSTEGIVEASPKKKKSKLRNEDATIDKQSNIKENNLPESITTSNKIQKNKNKNNPNSNAVHSKQDGEEDVTQNSKPQNTKKHKKKKIIEDRKNPNQIDNAHDGIHAKTETLAAQKKKEKKRGNKPTRRKAIDDRSFQLIINGKEVELIRFDGFPIMKKDAERLESLKNNMMKKGIPKSEVQRTMKLERRRAEKALARLRREVCYNCRKGGHNLSDCPDLRSNIPGVGAADGVCFKCGSTEHRQYECKVQRDKEFKFATCFICKEPGHIARQCPDNPKGLYPNGGCCKLCGDVTHLRKDCPTVKDQREETSIKLQTLGTTDNIEDIGQKVNPNSEQPTVKKPKKIKF